MGTDRHLLHSKPGSWRLERATLQICWTTEGLRQTTLSCSSSLASSTLYARLTSFMKDKLHATTSCPGICQLKVEDSRLDRCGTEALVTCCSQIGSP